MSAIELVEKSQFGRPAGDEVGRHGQGAPSRCAKATRAHPGLRGLWSSACTAAARARSFTVRKVSFGQGVERIFPLHSPTISKVEITRSAKVRRAKLYYLRDLKGKAARMKDTSRA